mgnify:CR=1 FL=1
MDNRTAFLNTIAQALGRPLRFEPQADAAPVNNYANERLTELSPQQRCDAFIQFASEVMLARCELTSEDQAADAALRLCEELGQQPVVLSGDSRLVELGITERLQQECNAVVWDPARGSENITRGVCRIWPDGVRRRGAVFRTGARAFPEPVARVLDFRAA